MALIDKSHFKAGSYSSCYQAAETERIAHWVKAGIRNCWYKAYSMRGASVTAAVEKVILVEVIQTVDWISTGQRVCMCVCMCVMAHMPTNSKIDLAGV